MPPCVDPIPNARHYPIRHASTPASHQAYSQFAKEFTLIPRAGNGTESDDLRLGTVLDC